MYPFMLRLSRWMAYLGGTVLALLIILTCVSIVGRSISGFMNSDFMQTNLNGLATLILSTGVGPIKGDFELVEAGMAFSIFAFLPICQMTAGHASVDIFTSGLSARSNRILVWLSDVIFALVMVVIAVQLYGGMISKMNSGQTTFLIEFPIWWAYAVSLVAAIVATFASLCIGYERTRELISGLDILPKDMGAGH